ncbi:MAG: response regulator transcription factor [bacterium]|nr:response regulator transcription factor [bacterium]
MIRVVLVDDDALVRAGLAMILGADSEIEVVGQAGSATEGAELVQESTPDVVVMDVRMPGMDGISATRMVQEMDDPPNVLILTTFHQDDYVLGALEAGASGFLLKDTPPRELIEAVKTTASGGAVLSPEDARTLATSYAALGGTRRSHEAREKLAPLSPRELDVAQAVARGLSNAQIASLLDCTEATVKASLTRVFEKLGVGGRVGVALLVHDAALPQ